MTLIYDPAFFEAVNAVKGSDWTGGSFLNTPNNPPGEWYFGGTPIPTIIGTRLHIATLTFRVLAGAVGQSTLLTGIVNTMVTNNQTQVVAGKVLHK